MSVNKKTAIQALVILFICGLIIWHTVHWHSTGMYLEMFGWLGTDRGYLAVLYNLGLMLVLGATLGFLMEKITELISLRRTNRNK